jgi:hypothetical protein
VMQHYSRLTGNAAESGQATPASDSGIPGTLEAGLTSSPHESAVAEMSSLLSTLGALEAQAQGFPSLPAPAQPSQGPQPYRPQVTDYASLLAPDADN